jgi:hypothetical protein
MMMYNGSLVCCRDCDRIPADKDENGFLYLRPMAGSGNEDLMPVWPKLLEALYRLME